VLEARVHAIAEWVSFQQIVASSYVDGQLWDFTNRQTNAEQKGAKLDRFDHIYLLKNMKTMALNDFLKLKKTRPQLSLYFALHCKQ
jgi:hypothetical protein